MNIVPSGFGTGMVIERRTGEGFIRGRRGAIGRRNVHIARTMHAFLGFVIAILVARGCSERKGQVFKRINEPFKAPF